MVFFFVLLKTLHRNTKHPFPYVSLSFDGAFHLNISNNHGRYPEKNTEKKEHEEDGENHKLWYWEWIILVAKLINKWNFPVGNTMAIKLSPRALQENKYVVAKKQNRENHISSQKHLCFCVHFVPQVFKGPQPFFSFLS